MKSNAEAVTGFGIHRNKGKFFSTFNSSRSSSKYQCFNCEAWKRGHKLKAVGQYHAGKSIVIFRFCRPCWQAYERSQDDQKQSFISRIREKVRKASEVII